MKDISSNFGSMVFNGAVMKAKLPASVYKALRETMRKGRTLDPATASTVAAAMKDWAIEKGATHFTHWFQPMTGITAEKHESFIERDGTDRAIMAFSGKNLIQGEPDASSFPSGGLRCTFEARGYTVWDTTSYAFIKDGVLCIPTAFCSYNGEALDMKTPLLRSMEALNTQALRVLRHLGSDAQRVTANVGAEQEYFLIDKEMFLKRPDLINCGRTLFGAPPPKGQETYDHYFGSLNPRVSAFMKEVDEELWKLGVYAKTRHNEVAPCQHELAVIFTTSNIATDHNQLVMETLKATANRHNLACLLHEKPFAGVNGSGKHNNWSLSTDTGENLLEPKDDAKFLLFLVAVIKAVDEYQDLLRVSCASAGNDHRLGGHEAPPAIMSIYLGDELTSILENEGKSTPADFCALPNALPAFKRDNTDRNRTSPFAFTGNKFEFRMLGSSFSVAGSNIVLNTAVADALCQLADALDGGKDCAALIKETFEAHKRIIFNGDNYSKEWAAEAARRGLSNLKTTPEAISQLIAEKNVTLYESHGVFTKAELNSRHDIRMEAYEKTLHIEALTMLDITKTAIIPAILDYENKLTNTALANFISDRLTPLTETLVKNIQALESAALPENIKALRATVDALELIIPRNSWPMPTYGEIFASFSGL